MKQKLPDAEYVIAVTGHRDIAPETMAGTRQHLDEVLAIDIRNFGGAERLLMLNALAIGGDSIVFDAARAQGIPTAAVLPLPLAEYEKDFAEGEERDGLHRRLAGCCSIWQPETALPRPDCYAALGATLARYADFLLALWDGDEDGPPGGTADVWRMMREGTTIAPVMQLPLPEKSDHAMTHVWVRRLGRNWPNSKR